MKCSVCRVKINKLYKETHTCKCEKVFCNNHKLNHNCLYNYKDVNKNFLKNELVKLENNRGLNCIF